MLFIDCVHMQNNARMYNCVRTKARRPRAMADTKERCQSVAGRSYLQLARNDPHRTLCEQISVDVVVASEESEDTQKYTDAWQHQHPKRRALPRWV